MSRLLLLLVALGLLLLAELSDAKSRKKINRKKVKDDGPDEEEEEEEKEFPCKTCVGAACLNETLWAEAEDCKLCFTLTKADNSTVRGCLGKDAAEPDGAEDDACLDKLSIQGHTGRVCFCEGEGCNSGVALAPLLLLLASTLLLIIPNNL